MYLLEYEWGKGWRGGEDLGYYLSPSVLAPL